jgi:hypothetical protein
VQRQYCKSSTPHELSARSESLHGQLYGAAVDLGKVNVERNPTSGRKVVRRRVLRASNAVVQRGLRRVGLWR